MRTIELIEVKVYRCPFCQFYTTSNEFMQGHLCYHIEELKTLQKGS